MNAQPSTTPTGLLACEVLRPELEWLMDATGQQPLCRFLPQCLHDTPHELRHQTQQAVHELEDAGASTILLGYGLCGQGLAGVHARKATLVLPKVHDCIPLLLGMSQEDMRHMDCGSTFWTSPGWLHCSQLPHIQQRAERYAEYKDKYGEESATWLMEQERAQLVNYTRVCHIQWPDFEPQAQNDAQIVSQDTGLPLHIEAADDRFLKALLEDHDNKEYFLQLPPGNTVHLAADGALEAMPI